MATIEQKPSIECACTMRLSEAEMKGLIMLLTYGTDSLMKIIDKNFTESDVAKNRSGLRSFFSSVGELESILRRANSARDVFTGTHYAVKHGATP